MTNSNMSEKEPTTEQKILDAARTVFQEKGFAAARTRDIAEVAGINLALLNYYYRSKKNLYDIVMSESIRMFFDGLFPILNSEETTLREKIAEAVAYYIDMLTENPDLVGFILTEVRTHLEQFAEKFGIRKKMGQAVVLRQLMEAVASGELPPIHPLHIAMNLMGMTVFPFVAAPLVQQVLNVPKAEFTRLMQERKRLIPVWIDAVLGAS